MHRPVTRWRFGSPGKLEAQIRLSIFLDNSVYQWGLTGGVIRAMIAQVAELCGMTTIVTRVDHMAAVRRNALLFERCGSTGSSLAQYAQRISSARAVRKELPAPGQVPDTANGSHMSTEVWLKLVPTSDVP